MGRIRSPPGKGKAAPLNPERWECRRGVQTRQEDEYDGMQKEGSSARVARCEGNALAVRRRRRRTETTHTVVSRRLLHYSNSSRDPTPPVRLVSSEGLVHFGGLFRRGFFAGRVRRRSQCDAVPRDRQRALLTRATQVASRTLRIHRRHVRSLTHGGAPPAPRPPRLHGASHRGPGFPEPPPSLRRRLPRATTATLFSHRGT